MLISSDTGDFICNSLEEYRKAIRTCVDTLTDYEIWCGKGKEKYPCIGIIGNQSCSAMNYFAKEDEMYASLGDMEKEGVMDFKTKSEIYEIAAYQLIPLERMMECADEFFHKMELPTCIEWEEL